MSNNVLLYIEGGFEKMNCKTEISFLQCMYKMYMTSFDGHNIKEENKINKKVKWKLCYEEKFT